MKKQGVLIYNHKNNQMDIRFGLLEYYGELRCGERLEVLIDGKWISTTIEYDAFWSCTVLESIDLPESVTTIDNYAFTNCYMLKEIHIADHVTSVGRWAFYGCKVLTIYAEANAQPSGWDADWNPSDRPVVWGYAS